MDLHKIDRSIRLIQTFAKQHPLVLAYSGGKDSDVCLRLCQLAKIPIQIVHNVTTIDPPFTLSHCANRGAFISRPKTPFFRLVEKKGLPSMFRRWCCSELKERYLGPCVVMGVRASESVARSKRYTEPTQCRIYTGKKESDCIYPIFDWTLQDVAEFVQSENINLHPYYYENGQPVFEKRLGCIGCPLQSDRGVSDYLRFPKHLRCLINSYKKYVETHRAIEGVYEDVVWQLFYSNHSDHKYRQTYHGLFPAPDAKQFLSEYFGISL